MHSRLGLVAAAASVSAGLSLFVGPAMAHATEADSQFLSVVADLGLHFETPEEATEAGNNVCDIVAEGSVNNIGPAIIRGNIVDALLAQGVDAAAATQLMRGAVDAYCPEYDAVVAG
ncbi:Uncharacterised protein [Mycolicibacterium vanbaalenii]|uniref:DUF732 domain-containing protein n=1 Tax=Mycolicibacterium vanbaalenii TaxID=110539 RepID=A0A5S9R7T8_MYCVN|nr:DUF732 domain-containing protein [Mycolicibacterium vanbaalenii]CAA0132133.1 Uncharacterised protein [Mycolicibacterium vanbaalenii]